MRQHFQYYLFSFLILVTPHILLAQPDAAGQNKLNNFPIAAKLSDLIADENIAPYLAYFKKNEILQWQVSVPINHDALSPQGLLVYISPQDSGEIYEMWKPVLIEKNLIWISAEKSGNDFLAQRRVLQALLAIQLAGNYYKLDKRRIYVAGFSGGGRVASMMAPFYPEVFTGGIFMGGANYWGPKMPEKISLMSKRSYVFINGSKDFNVKESKKVSEQFTRSGLKNVKFFEVDGLAHLPPGGKWLGEAIDYLDANKSSD